MYTHQKDLAFELLTETKKNCPVFAFLRGKVHDVCGRGDVRISSVIKLASTWAKAICHTAVQHRCMRHMLVLPVKFTV